METLLQGQRRRSQRTEIVQLISRLAINCKNPARILELFYWSREPELAEIMRNIIGLPDEAKTTLHAFFRLAESDPKSISVTVNADGDLTLTSSIVAGLVTTMTASTKPKSVQSIN